MIHYIEGDLFLSPAKVIVNAVNTEGVMGKGIALEYKKRYPDMFRAYQEACENNALKIGNLLLCYEADHWVLLFPTKRNWRNPSKMEYIETGLKRFRDIYAEKNITSVAFPQLGCGNGELRWEDVMPVMEHNLSDLPIEVYIYSYTSNVVPEHQAVGNTTKWLREHARDMSFTGVVEDVRYNYSIVPLAMQMNHSEWRARWNENALCFQNNGNETIMVSEETFHALWDSLRNAGIVDSSNAELKEQLVYKALCSMGYLSPIKIKGRTGKATEGYQVNEGSERVFSLTGLSRKKTA